MDTLMNGSKALGLDPVMGIQYRTLPPSIGQQGEFVHRVGDTHHEDQCPYSPVRETSPPLVKALNALE